MSNGTDAFLYGGVRTPYGKYRGRLSSISAVDLGATALGNLRERYPPIEHADGLLMGMTIQAGCGVNAARVAGHRAGLGLGLPSITLNNACLAGIDSAVDATRRIRCGEGQLYIIGGMHSASRAPHLEDQDQVRSLAIHTDGVICPISRQHVGFLSDVKNRELGLTRERQDEWALESHRRAARADFLSTGEVAPLLVHGQEITIDEAIRPSTSLEALAALKPAFVEGGTITPGNAPPLSDGAAVAIIAGRGFADDAGHKPLAKIVDWGYSAGPDSTLHNQPWSATKRLLQKQGLKSSDIDLYEINEAFAGVVLAAIDELSLPIDHVNPNGGAIAIGHPDAATATRQLLTLALELQRRQLRRGVATLCGGGGQGIAILIERGDV
jgi:acetyl-CoA C-acetyltransferase